MTSVVSLLNCGEANALIKSCPLFVCASARQADNVLDDIQGMNVGPEEEKGGGDGGHENCQHRVNQDSR